MAKIINMSIQFQSCQVTFNELMIASPKSSTAMKYESKPSGGVRDIKPMTKSQNNHNPAVDELFARLISFCVLWF